MKLLSIRDLEQSFSYHQGPKPKKVWVFSVAEPMTHQIGAAAIGSQGISCETLETIFEHLESWVGWGFSKNRAWLLFDLKSDAIYAKVMLGDGK